MKRIFIEILFVFLFGFSSQPTQAQGTTYLSNLGEGRFTGVTLENGQWLAQPFQTGTVSAGYNLDSIQVLVASEVQLGSIHDTGSFNFFLYSDQNGQPENNLGSLSGFNPIGLGTYTYTASGIILSASTTYWIVATEVVPTGSSLTYIWESRDANFNNPNNPFDSGSQWNILSPEQSFDGNNWSALGNGFLEFAVNATPVPEPETFALAGLGLAIIFFCKKK